MTQSERTADMVSRYGEAVKPTTAGRILDRDRSTILRMVADGRLDAACAGTMVDVRSIARYICEPAAENTRARLRKAGNTAARWAV